MPIAGREPAANQEQLSLIAKLSTSDNSVTNGKGGDMTATATEQVLRAMLAERDREIVQLRLALTRVGREPTPPNTWTLRENARAALLAYRDHLKENGYPTNLIQVEAALRVLWFIAQ